MVSCMTGGPVIFEIRDTPFSLVVQQENPMLLWVLPVQLEAPLLERLGEECTDASLRLLWGQGGHKRWAGVIVRLLYIVRLAPSAGER